METNTALDGIKQMIKDGHITQDVAERYVPELKEREDERIRKELITHCRNTRCVTEEGAERIAKWIAWLEKQCTKSFETCSIKEKAHQIAWETSKHYDQSLSKESWCEMAALDMASWLKKQGEKKSTDNLTQQEAMDIAVAKCFNEQYAADKVEPKFYKGEWLCENEPNNYARFIQILEIVNVQGKERYRISRDIHNDKDVVEFDFAEKYFHKFDIKDAKDGDVLYLKHDGKEHIIIYKGVIKERFRTFISAYCAYNGIVDAFCFADVSRYADIAYGSIMPATKEQRDQLEKAMFDAGYKWNKEKLKLEKI